MIQLVATEWTSEDGGNLFVAAERFGECRGVVEAVVKLARERLITWRSHRKGEVLIRGAGSPLR